MGWPARTRTSPGLIGLSSSHLEREISRARSSWSDHLVCDCAVFQKPQQCLSTLNTSTHTRPPIHPPTQYRAATSANTSGDRFSSATAGDSCSSPVTRWRVTWWVEFWLMNLIVIARLLVKVSVVNLLTKVAPLE